MIPVTIILAAAVVFFFPSDALAWGPATHLDIGWRVLHNSHGLTGALMALIEKYPYDFLYGNISADIVIAKSMMKEKVHCHNWSVGRKVLDIAESDSQKAFAYGYLSHLAADTVAHNDFIPEMMIRSFATTIHRHIYWEMRFDAHAGKRVWLLPDKIALKGHPDNDALLNAVIEGAPLSFKTNKRVFSNIVNIQRIEHWHRMLNHLSKKSVWVFKKADREAWLASCMDAVSGFINDPDGAVCTERDPTGRRNLREAAGARKRLKTARRHGRDVEPLMDEELKRLT
ncbi:MAG: zinc dependent phospholipase C family protein [Thermodesulfobacteriota bacterium]